MPEPADPAHGHTDTDTGETDAGQEYGLDELADAVEFLSGRLDQTEAQFGTALEKVSAAVVDLREQIAKLLQQEKDKDIEPSFWVHRATPADWQQLADWVDRMQDLYGLLTEYNVFPCWPLHAGMVEELAGIYHSWRRTQAVDELNARPGKDKKPGSNDLTAWHDRWLWPFLQRVRGGHYRLINCKNGHQETIRTDSVTIRTYPFMGGGGGI